MDKFWTHLKRMLGPEDVIRHTDNMYSNPLIDLNSKLPKPRRQLLRSHYVFMDIANNPGFGDSLFVICETDKTHSGSSKRTLLFLAVIVAFIVGLATGVVLPGVTDDFLKAKSKATGQFVTVSCNSSKVMQNENAFVNGLFWSEVVERALPAGWTEEDGARWMEFVHNTAIVKVEEGCGRMQNRMVTFADGTKACCRYRQNTDQIQGEMFSYYLGRLLGLRNMVPSAVVVVNSSSVPWRAVAPRLAASHWTDDHPVVFTRYINDLLPANIPPAFRHLGRRSSPVEVNISSRSEAVEMAQWSDLVILDYLTGNLDRVVNNLYNLQWNPDMLSQPAHNLARVRTSDLLVFLDNESGMLHGYRLLDKYETYHSLLLASICVFRRSTVDALTALSLQTNPGALLTTKLPSPDLLPPLPDVNGATLRLRVARVLQQVLSCASRLHTQAHL